MKDVKKEMPRTVEKRRLWRLPDLDDSMYVAGEDVGGDILVADLGEDLEFLLALGLLPGLLVGGRGHRGADPLATHNDGRIRVKPLLSSDNIMDGAKHTQRNERVRRQC